MKSKQNEINKALLAGDYPKLEEIAFDRINNWLKRKFGASFSCHTSREAIRLIKSISAWTRQHKLNMDSYIKDETWQGQKIDILLLQKILAKGIGRPTRKRSRTTVAKMFSEMLHLFSPADQIFIESTFERNKLRNFKASSKLEGIILED
ncbi:hypothetical protein [Pseudomonas viridiflava]|uniref:hypothetical protein n=1 Tax=Pseudomonas viridiflava TaxID=33069 RepID=UPI000F013065|nr:hypothetical protein [Pseudomonas viridiflava]